MRTGLLLASALALFPTLTLAGPHDADRAQNHRVHFAIGNSSAHSVHRGFYHFNGVTWVFAPVPFPYGGLAINGDYVYDERFPMSSILMQYHVQSRHRD